MVLSGRKFITTNGKFVKVKPADVTTNKLFNSKNDNQLQTPILTVDSNNILTISNIDEHCTSINLKKNSINYKNLFTITDSYTNVTASEHCSLIGDDETMTITLSADGVDYKLPQTISVTGATGTFNRISNTQGTLTISNATANVSFSVEGAAFVPSVTVFLGGYPMEGTSSTYYTAQSPTDQTGTQLVKLTSTTTSSTISVTSPYIWVQLSASIYPQSITEITRSITGGVTDEYIIDNMNLTYKVTDDGSISISAYWICFAAETKVLTANGYTNIENLNNNDEILSYNLETNAIEPAIIDKWILQNGVPIVSEIKFEDGLSITCTQQHALYTSDGWKCVEPNNHLRSDITKLNIGDKVLTKEGSYVTVSEIINIVEKQPVYHLLLNNSNALIVAGKDSDTFIIAEALDTNDITDMISHGYGE